MKLTFDIKIICEIKKSVYWDKDKYAGFSQNFDYSSKYYFYQIVFLKSSIFVKKFLFKKL